MGHNSQHPNSESAIKTNHEVLASVIGRGFSAMLTPDQAAKLEGIWPESKSFNGYGLGPVPAKFKGECSAEENFTLSNCNRKIVGARFYSTGFEAENGPLESFGLTFFRSARDSDGHGTHTASTIAGAPVDNVNLFGVGTGTASGDVLAALDDATNDGVDIISMSLGPDPPPNLSILRMQFQMEGFSIHPQNKESFYGLIAGSMALVPGVTPKNARFALVHGATHNTKRYIVYTGHNSQHPNSESAIKTNHEVLASVIGSHDGVQDAALHHYTKTFRGFSAMEFGLNRRASTAMPAKFKGECSAEENFPLSNCNRDSAPLAIYKACWFNLCSDADVLAALDDATNDGVDIISMSLGPDPPQPIYFENPISIGNFYAFQKGIVISASAGSSFFTSTATNIAPWILTVAASFMDREIQTNI
ncbi:unnamed protein product [Fraxinus pennsylvanica]|uniref:Uncharacterized protein n=1 Tax=Fraxinus pennsylvanica TaxID=56036 RepID=A0AAD2E4E4_9LAMI|nr:unnamed protein product [Fraxinus pennsylvanica]